MEALRKRAATLLSVDTSKLEIVGDDHAPNSSPTKEKSLIQEKSNEDHSPPETGRIDDSFQDGVTVRSEDDNTGFSRPKVRFLPRQ